MKKPIGSTVMFAGGLIMVIISVAAFTMNQADSRFATFLVWGIGNMWWGWAMKNEKSTIIPQIIVVAAALSQIVYYFLNQNK